MKPIRSSNFEYGVAELIAEARTYRLYLCVQRGTDRVCLFQVATQPAFNGQLDCAAFLLAHLAKMATAYDESYAQAEARPGAKLHYELSFPEVVESFVLPADQGQRRANVYAFRNTSDPQQMVPLTNILQKDRRRVDLRTSVWIMGRALKMLAFAHGLGITVGALQLANILIEPETHGVVFFDWTVAKLSDESLSPSNQGVEIAQLAQTVIAVAGGDYRARFFPDDEGGRLKSYTDHLLWLADGHAQTTQRAHAKFYELVDGLWPRGYYPFTWHSL